MLVAWALPNGAEKFLHRDLSTRWTKADERDWLSKTERKREGAGENKEWWRSLAKTREKRELVPESRPNLVRLHTNYKSSAPPSLYNISVSQIINKASTDPINHSILKLNSLKTYTIIFNIPIHYISDLIEYSATGSIKHKVMAGHRSTSA